MLGPLKSPKEKRMRFLKLPFYFQRIMLGTPTVESLVQIRRAPLLSLNLWRMLETRSHRLANPSKVSRLKPCSSSAMLLPLGVECEKDQNNGCGSPGAVEAKTRSIKYIKFLLLQLFSSCFKKANATYSWSKMGSLSGQVSRPYFKAITHGHWPGFDPLWDILGERGVWITLVNRLWPLMSLQ